MKLKNLAAMLLRILGVCSVLTGVSDGLEAILDTHKTGTAEAALGGLIGGLLLIYFSKRLAALLCKGLDDDSA